jgi:hypothetical protein
MSTKAVATVIQRTERTVREWADAKRLTGKKLPDHGRGPWVFRSDMLRQDLDRIGRFRFRGASRRFQLRRTTAHSGPQPGSSSTSY